MRFEQSMLARMLVSHLGDAKDVESFQDRLIGSTFGIMVPGFGRAKGAQQCVLWGDAS